VRRALRVLAWNVAALVGLWLLLLLVTAAISDGINLGKRVLPRSDERAELPNYEEDRERARRVFADFKKTVEEYAPYVAWRRMPLASEHVNIDADGRRVHRAGRDAGPGAPSIAFFGGSTLWGTGSSDDETIPAWFDRMSRGWQVFNYGETGYTTRQALARLVNLVTTGRAPDVAVFYDGYNHIWTHCNLAVTERLHGHMLEARLSRALTERPRFGYVFSEIVAPVRDFAIRVLGKRRFTRDRFACSSDPQRAEQVAETLVRLWEVAHALMAESGGRFHAFLQPLAYIGAARIDHLKTRGEEAGDQFRAVYPLLHRRIAERGLPWVTDLSRAFDGEELIFIDSAHVSPNGNRIIAQRMLERLDIGR
jgi:hypothetical protein